MNITIARTNTDYVDKATGEQQMIQGTHFVHNVFPGSPLHSNKLRSHRDTLHREYTHICVCIAYQKIHLDKAEHIAGRRNLKLDKQTSGF